MFNEHVIFDRVSRNLCPICGQQSYYTSLTCPHHVNIIYDNQGNIIDYYDYIINKPHVRI